ncbi:hypothetical protein [Polyangium sorediatum]|uniref:ABC transporter permease n=1 Tax=Polyangium sorediatum TaxID=889274 RepID=A0ABT6P408_9BACT|nr:hypothetical protein [Polyangium sorediatum]MDI1435279.1 hypothetical protein [Polyangium sorediatum]
MALSRARLGRTTLSRLGLACGVLLGASFAVLAIVLRATEGTRAPLEGLVGLGAASITLLAAAPTTLAAASDRSAEDREAGIEALAATHGVHAQSLHVVRWFASMVQITRAIGLPLVGLALVTVALSSSGAMAMRRIVFALGLSVFSVIAGTTLGTIATFAARMGGKRGRVLLAAIVIVPWMLAELAGRGSYSIPGALSALLSLLVDAGGGAGT